MNNIKKIKDILKNKKWSWWGQRAHDALGLEQLIDFDFLVCCDWGEDIKKLWGDKVVSMELLNKVRKNYSNEDLNYFLDGNSGVAGRFTNSTNCIMYRSIEGLEKLTRTNNKIKIYSTPVRLKNTFDNKILFRKKLKSIVIPGEIGFLKDLKYEEIKNSWGEKFVLKYPVASSGKKTHLVENFDMYNDLKNTYPDEPVIIEKYMKGYSMNINAVIGAVDSFISGLSIQIVGIDTLHNGKFGFCGNDFTKARLLDAEIKNKIYSITMDVMQWMSEWGYRGMMGIDFIISEGIVYPVEINPRFQNSTSILTLLEIEKYIVPLVYFHLKEFDHELDSGLQIPVPPFSKEGCRGSKGGVTSEINEYFNGAQLILHNLEDKTIKIRKPLKPGIYSFTMKRTCRQAGTKENSKSPYPPLLKGEVGGDLRVEYMRNGFSVLDCSSEDEFAVCGAVPSKDALIEPEAPLVKLHFKREILNSDLMTLNTEIELIVKKIYNELIGD